MGNETKEEKKTKETGNNQVPQRVCRHRNVKNYETFQKVLKSTIHVKPPPVVINTASVWWVKEGVKKKKEDEEGE